MKLAAVVLLLVVLYAAALELIPWTWPAVLAVVMAAAVWRARRLPLIGDIPQLPVDPELPVDPAVQRRNILVVAVIAVIVVAVWIILNIQIVTSSTTIYN